MFKNVVKEIITIPAQMSYLSQIRDFVEQVGRKHKYTDKLTNSFKLVIDEACTNIIRHGYRDVKGGEITLKAIIRRQSLTIVVIDQGKSYDPRQANTPDLEKYINIGKRGGLGIMMMRKLMDDVQYNITSRGNELRLTKTREQIIHSKPRAMWDNLNMRTKYTAIASTVLTIILAFIFFTLYFQIENNTTAEIIEIARAQVSSLADNSSENLQRSDKDMELWELTKSVKDNYPNLVNEVFIVDAENKIRALSNPLKGIDIYLSEYILPSEYETISDTAKGLSIYKYATANKEIIYDFSADIHATILENSPVIGRAHVWVNNDFIIDRANSTKLQVIFGILILLMISYVLIYLLISKIVQPFHSLADWVREVGAGTVDEDEIDIDSSDELGEIAQAFNHMTGKFREAQVNMVEQQRLQKELQVAQEIQHMLLPSDFPKVEGYDIASYYEAAKEVGGDLFDFVDVDEDTIGICVADVSGKGVPGSLIMTMIRTALRLEARGNKNPAEVLSRVNRFVTDDMKRGMFVTMFYLVLDSRNRVIHYASAGHNPMILYRRSTKQTYYLNPSGFPVGIQLPDITLFDKKIQEDTIRLREDDMLVLYTDGITEAMNPQRELYRDERFLDAIKENSHYDVGEFVKQIKDDIGNHTKGYPQNDDITYVAIKEKMMPGEVIFNIHNELFRLIEEEGIAVKDACEKMKVSQYAYRKYKKVKDEKGTEGLKELLNETDFIEKKHLSLEVKTKLYEIVRKNPEFGAKKISEMLDTEEFGFTKLEEHRIYQELKAAKLNTRAKREAFVQRGGKKRIKLPGTPLLTMDGDVILNYESAEKVIADRKGIETPTESTPSFQQQDINQSQKKVKEFVSSSREKSGEQKQEIKEELNKQDKVDKPVVEEKQEEQEETKDPTEIKKEEISKQIDEAILPTKKPKEKQEDKEKPEVFTETIIEETSEQVVESVITAEKPEEKQTEIIPEESKEKTAEEEKIPGIKAASVEEQKQEIIEERSPLPQVNENLIVEAEKNLHEKSEQGSVPAIRRPIESFVASDTVIDKEAVEYFYRTISDDITIIENLINKEQIDTISEKSLKKIIITLKIISKNPILKKLENIKNLIDQVIKGISFLHNNMEQIKDKNEVIENTKEMLNYIKKENILFNSDLIIEKVNELGIKLFRLENSINKKEEKYNSEIALIRQKIADKKILKGKHISEVLQKSGGE
jgi:serine phosphatase RsbU (regulator of sigma subunit)/anti-sigma regulatory factor (Ser/Thr protein kinase)